jgi:hypothetical protein
MTTTTTTTTTTVNEDPTIIEHIDSINLHGTNEQIAYKIGNYSDYIWKISNRNTTEESMAVVNSVVNSVDMILDQPAVVVKMSQKLYNSSQK